MTIFSFKRCESELEVKKIKKIYLIILIIFLIIYFVRTLKIFVFTEIVSSIVNLFFSLITILAAYKIGIKLSWAILLGIVAPVGFTIQGVNLPVVSLMTGSTILAWKHPVEKMTGAIPSIIKYKTNWKYILIVVILATVVGSGALWFSVKQEPPYQPSEIKKPEKIVEDETANWKTYRNEKYGFEIKYPSNWIIVYESIGKEVVTFADEKEAETQREKQAGEIRCLVEVGVYNNEGGLSLYDWAINKWGKPEKREAGKVSEVKINDLEGIKYEFMSMGMETNILFSKNNKVIDAQTTFDGCENLHTLFDQILSTFRFLE